MINYYDNESKWPQIKGILSPDEWGRAIYYCGEAGQCKQEYYHINMKWHAILWANDYFLLWIHVYDFHYTISTTILLVIMISDSRQTCNISLPEWKSSKYGLP